MAETASAKGQPEPPGPREKALAAALRANLKRRKAAGKPKPEKA